MTWMPNSACVGIDLEWDCVNRTLDCSVDEQIETALQEFEHAILKLLEQVLSDNVQCSKLGSEQSWVDPGDCHPCASVTRL